MGTGSFNTKIQALNTAIIPWAQKMNKTESPIWTVDQYTGFNGAADLRDGVHPNASGDKKMAAVWEPALIHAFSVAKDDKQKMLRAREAGAVEFTA
jgi:lysophospholipase L1-like esterase